MLAYVARRVLLAIPTLVGITLLTFLVGHALPRDLVLVNLGDRASHDPTLVLAFRQRAGLDRPLAVQFVLHLKNLLRGDLGVSIATNRPVSRELWLSVPATVELAMVALSLALLPGISLGVLAAARRNSIWDFLTRGLSALGLAVPTFWLALLMLFVFYFHLGWTVGPGRLDAGLVPPPGITGMYTIDALLGRDNQVFRNAVAHLLLPSAVLGIICSSLIARITRERMVEVLEQDYIRTARAKGLSVGSVVASHALRNALIPIVTVAGTLFAQLMAGTVLTETIFSWPGLGRYAFSSASNLDFPAIMGVSFVVGVTYIAINLIVDLLYGLLNPRIRFD
jgi:peptide/nickel transport system permease protein